MSELWFLFILEPWTILCFSTRRKVSSETVLPKFISSGCADGETDFWLKTAVQFLDKMEFFII